MFPSNIMSYNAFLLDTLNYDHVWLQNPSTDQYKILHNGLLDQSSIMPNYLSRLMYQTWKSVGAFGLWSSWRKWRKNQITTTKPATHIRIVTAINFG